MDTKASITVTPDFIKMMGRKLYSMPLSVVLPRELLQNSRDATIPGGRIEMKMENGPTSSRMVCRDTGVGMSEDTLLNVFLRMGASLKADGSVGGFGAAKAVIFSCDKWQIKTGKLVVDETLSYHNDLTKSLKGTQVVCEFAERFSATSYLMMQSCDVKNLWLNGEKVRPYRPHKIIATIGDALSGKVRIGAAHKIGSTSNLIFWRIRGLTQFIQQLGYGDDYGFNVTVDFDDINYRPTSDNYPFNMSRESVKEFYTNTVLRAIAPLAKNKKTARAKFADPKKATRKERVRKNKVTGKLYVEAPKKIEPWMRHLLKVWEEVINTMGVDPGSKFGMTFDDSTVAERRRSGDGTFYLLNPILVKDYLEGSKIDGLGLVMYLWHLATHEVTHKFYSDHDEDFTSRENRIASETIGKLLKKVPTIRVFGRKAVASMAGKIVED